MGGLILRKGDRSQLQTSLLVFVISGSFSIDDRDGNDKTTNKQFDWSSEENERAARVARTYE